jgi:tRNA(Ile)-lysidine synthase
MLLFGGNQDETLEFALMSLLIKSSLMTGKYGAYDPSSSNLPHCEGLYGVHRSDWLAPSAVSRKWSGLKARDAFAFLPAQRGGVLKVQPLVAFPKDRLQATCRMSNVEWVEDPTNSDPTFTLRNAIRHVYGKHALPSALRKDCLLQVLQSGQRESQIASVRGQQLFDEALLTLDTRCGVLFVQPPALQSLSDLTGFAANDNPVSQESIYGAALVFVRKLVVLVTNTQFREQRTVALQTAVASMFPGTIEGLEHVRAQSKFTAHGVLFQHGQNAAGQEGWTLSRQPPRAQAQALEVALPTESVTSEKVDFDGRFWIGATCPGAPPGSLCLRLLSPQDIAACRRREEVLNALYPNNNSNIASSLSSVLRAMRPRGSETLPVPVIAISRSYVPEAETSGFQSHRGKFDEPLLEPGDAVAFPTFGFHDHRCFVGQWSWLGELKYSAQYQQLSLGAHAEKDVIVGFSGSTQRTGTVR